jgi:hypothetical protein
MSENNKTTVEKKSKEDSRTKLEKLLDMKQRLEQALAFEKAKQLGVERKADAHLKAALGAGFLALLHQEKLPATIRAAILMAADSGIQKVGLARTKFETLKGRYGTGKAEKTD